ncbi:MAG: DUF2220 domain-containing protein [Lachnospiraceae bacterium]|nr:DUF2220 domain-containing protein [Lachnospiraceae bacterium]
MTADFEKEILCRLLKKAEHRKSTGRRVILHPTEIYKDYTSNNADIEIKQAIYEAVQRLGEREFITFDTLKFSLDIQKIYLQENRLEELYEFLRTEYGMMPKSRLRAQVEGLLKEYGTGGELLRYYCNRMEEEMGQARWQDDPERIEANLKMLSFLDKNEEELYVREASVLVYGDSKYFEENNYEEICTVLRAARNMPREEDEQNDEILSLYHVSQPEQELCIRGPWRIDWEGCTLETGKLKGGAALLSSDVADIRRIIVSCPVVMTIENKASYQRMSCSDRALFYLGGFAGRAQLRFLKKVIQDNPQCSYYHFGDIDVGGFLIHRHLCRALSWKFELYCMGIRQLRDERFGPCLKTLTENDRSRMKTLCGEEAYRPVLAYMKEKGVKLEQEIVSYYCAAEETDRKEKK